MVGWCLYLISVCVCVLSSVKAPEDKQSKQPVPNIDHLLSNIGRTRMPAEELSKYLQIPTCAVLHMSQSCNAKEENTVFTFQIHVLLCLNTLGYSWYTQTHTNGVGFS